MAPIADKQAVDAALTAMGASTREGGLGGSSEDMRAAVRAGLLKGLTAEQMKAAIPKGVFGTSTPIGSDRSTTAIWNLVAAAPAGSSEQAASSARDAARGAEALLKGFAGQYPELAGETAQHFSTIAARIRSGADPGDLLEELTKAYAGSIPQPGKITRAGGATGATGSTAAKGGTRAPMTDKERQALLDKTVDAYMLHQPDETNSVYANDPELYAAASAEWAEKFPKVLEAAMAYREKNAGVRKLSDGMVISQAQYDGLDPLERAQVDAWFDEQDRDREARYNDVAKAHGLDEYTAARQSVLDENSRRTAEFNMQNQRTTTQLAYDASNVERAAQQVSRQISGAQESRARADLVTGTRERNAGRATGGKLDFSANDFGGLLGDMAYSVGLDPNATALRYPTNVRLDPSGLLDQGDARFGVQGPLAAIPDLITDPNSIAQVPGLLGTPARPVSAAAPMARRPVPSVRPTVSAAPAVGARPPVIVGPAGQVMDMDPGYGLLG